MPLPDHTIRHLSHSSFLLRLSGLVMVFDYFGQPSNTNMACEAIQPEDLDGADVYVIASHSHKDHFNPEIFEWRQQASQIHYLLSYDIPVPSFTVTRLKPGDVTSVGSIRVRAYASTDHGLAYSIYAQDRHIYFAGDNAFWNWDGDLEDAIYHRIALDAIDTRIPMDIAFQVCDPRLDGKGDGGIHIFARAFQPKLLVPIHSFGNYTFNAKVEQRLRANGYVQRFWCVRRPGDVFSLDS